MSDEFLECEPGAAQRPLTTAGRLLRRVTEQGPLELSALARGVGVSARRLEECRRGVRPLELESQMRLAAAVATMAPEHAGGARALYAQAQAALRVEASVDCRHTTYPRQHFR